MNYLLRMCTIVGFSLILVSTTNADQHQTYQLGPFLVAIPAQQPINYPMEGVKPTIVVTNTSNAPMSTGAFRVSVKESGAQLTGCPVSRMLPPGASTKLSCIADLQASTLSLGTPSILTFVFDAGGGNGSVEVPLAITKWQGSDGSILTPPTGQALPVSVRVTDDAGNPITADVIARAGSSGVSFSPSGTDGLYNASLPPATTWIVSAEASGRKTAYLPLSDPSTYTGKTLVLPTQSAWVSYQAAAALERGIGPWQGRTNRQENAMLIGSGMEHWSSSMQPSISQSKLRLFDEIGNKRWEFAPGYEAWASDLSPDGQWVAVGSLDPSGSTSGVSGPPGTLYLLNAATGSVVSQQVLDADYMRTPTPNYPAPPGSNTPVVREMRFSPNSEYLGIGDNKGDFVLIARQDVSAPVWNKNVEGGEARAIRFNFDGSKVYVAFGSGETVAYRVSDGAELWRAETYSWVHPEGLVLSPDGLKLGVMAQMGDVSMLDANTGAVLWHLDTKSYGWWASFSGDSAVFLAGTQTGGTIGLNAETGAKIFSLPGGKGGGFAAGRNFFLLGNQALYDRDGSRISNFLTGLEGAHFSNWQVAWVSRDAKTIFLGQQQSESLTEPVVFTTKGTVTGILPFAVLSSATASNLPAPKSASKNYLRIYNPSNFTGVIKVTVRDANGAVIGAADSILVSDVSANSSRLVKASDIANAVGVASWTGRVSVTLQADYSGLKVDNLVRPVTLPAILPILLG